MTMRKGLGKSFIRILLGKKRLSLALLILDAMLFQDFLHCALLKCDRAYSDDLCIGVLGEISYVP